MGKGKQAQTKTEQKLPSEIAPYYKDLMFRAGNSKDVGNFRCGLSKVREKLCIED